MRTLIMSLAMAALAGQAFAETPQAAVASGAEALMPGLFAERAATPPLQIAALGNPPPHPIEPPLRPAPAIAPKPLEAPAISADEKARDAVAIEPLLDLTATPD